MLSTRIRTSIESYVAAWSEPDSAKRMQLLERACTDDVLVRTSGRAVHGRTQLDAMIADFQARRPGERGVFTSAVDVQGQLFRFTGVVEGPAGAGGAGGGESFDAGECDEDGRIRILLTFVGTAPPAQS